MSLSYRPSPGGQARIADYLRAAGLAQIESHEDEIALAIGDTSVFSVTVRNVGNTPLTDIHIDDQFDPAVLLAAFLGLVVGNGIVGAAVGGPEDSRTGGGQDEQRVGRVHDHPAHGAGPHPVPPRGPGYTAVSGAEDPQPRRIACVAVAGADIHHRRVGIIDQNGGDAQGWQVINC